jgi:rRNA maturation endonuclease Nob1
MNEVLTHQCKSCQNTFTGSYCNQCGEKVIAASDRSFKTN